jgi:hypothetical protein
VASGIGEAVSGSREWRLAQAWLIILAALTCYGAMMFLFGVQYAKYLEHK